MEKSKEKMYFYYKNDLKNHSTNNGITLIALVVTIIVLLILAGISIQMLTGQSGILTQAQEAQRRTEIAQADEEQKLEQMEQWMEEQKENKGETKNVLEDFTKNPNKYKKPSSQTETDDVGISENGTVLDMDLWDYEIDEETGSFALVGIFDGSNHASPSFTFKPNEKGGYEGIKITTDSSGKKVAEFIGGIPTYLRVKNKIFILRKIGLGAFCGIVPEDFLNDNSIVPDYLVQKLNFNILKIKLPTTINMIERAAFVCNFCITELKIPDDVSIIKEIAFGWCSNLESITILENVKNIEDGAFYECNSLSTINYRGTREQWEEINIDESGNDALKNANINYEYQD